ncbi:3'-5' exonuclease [Dongshaea marina]|uniref:3'-5' exonuclease n=1 Tax=Dongshaea marina TaxID=2047966 RepID=UPI000D3EC12F|nr:3'-5' exonuclease [Dongshaea marina]
MSNLAILDTETTGLNPETDELLEIAICDQFGNPILNSLVRPVNKTKWPEAQAIHGITPADVASAPTLGELAPKIREAVAGRTIVIYNRKFDAPFLGSLLDGAEGIECAMIRWAEHNNEYREKDGNLKWHKLTKAAEEAGHTWGKDEAHRALADARATATVWAYLDGQQLKHNNKRQGA